MRQDARAAILAAAFTAGLTHASTLLAQNNACGIDEDWIVSHGPPAEIVFGADDRQTIASSDYPWRAIGLLLTPFGSCTGTLVDVDLVLTAAHCISDYMLRDMVPADVSFHAGMQGGRAYASASAVRIISATDQPIGDAFGGDFGDDWAFVILDDPIGADVGTVAIFDLTTADLAELVRSEVAVTQAGYSADRPDILTGHLGCHVQDFHESGWLEHDCDTLPGDSGSPLLIERNRQVYVIGVASALRCDPEGRAVFNSAVDARVFAGTYRELTRSQRVALQVNAPNVQAQPQQRSGGPRIIRICETDC